MALALTRRDLLRYAGTGSAALVVAACQPKVVEKIVEKPVEKVVKETVVVEKEVEKEVTRVVDAPAEQKASGPVELRFHFRAGSGTKPSGSEWPIIMDALDEFMAANPNIVVKREEIPTAQQTDYWAKLTTMIASGTVGDITWTSSTTEDHQRIAYMGALAALEEYIASENINLDDYFPAAIEGAMLDGKLYGLPFTIHPGSCAFLIYNPTMFEEKGFALPTADSTTDDLQEWAVGLTKEGVYGLQPNRTGQSFEGWLRAFGGHPYNEDGTESRLNTPEAVAWATYLHRFFQVDKVAPLEVDQGAGGAPAMLAAGQLGMLQDGPWAINTARLAVGDKFELGVQAFPKGPAGVRGLGGYVNSWAVFSQSKFKAEAVKAIYAMSNHRAGVLRLSLREGLAAMPGVYEDPLFKDHPSAALIHKVVLEAPPQVMTHNFRASEVMSVTVNELDSLWLGKAEPTQQFMDGVTAKVNTILSKPR